MSMCLDNSNELVAGRNKIVRTSSAYTVKYGDRTIVATGAITITLPAAHTMPGVIIAVLSMSDTVTVTEAVAGEHAHSDETVASGYTGIYYSDGTSWTDLV